MNHNDSIGLGLSEIVFKKTALPCQKEDIFVFRLTKNPKTNVIDGSDDGNKQGKFYKLKNWSAFSNQVQKVIRKNLYCKHNLSVKLIP